MNYFAHALPFLDDPYLVAGTCVPDWLTVVDRRLRLRVRAVAPFRSDPVAEAAALARGIVQHLYDDARFHETRAFAECQFAITSLAAARLNGEAGFRPGFLGHLLTEVLLDAALAENRPQDLERFFSQLDGIDPLLVESLVTRFAARPPKHLAAMIEGFRCERIIFDYFDDRRLLVRMNQVMRRVGFPPLPDDFVDLLPRARSLVAARRRDLLAGIPVRANDGR